MITILPFVGQHPRMVFVVVVVVVIIVVVPSLFSSRIIDVGGRFVAAFLGRPQHARTHFRVVRT